MNGVAIYGLSWMVFCFLFYGSLVYTDTERWHNKHHTKGRYLMCIHCDRRDRQERGA